MRHCRWAAWLLLTFCLTAACSTVSDLGADVPRITPEELVALQDAGETVVIVDTRVPRQYAIRHIPGAISIPVRETADRLDELPKDATIVFY